MPGSDIHYSSHTLHVHPSNTYECEFRVPVPVSSTYSTHPLQPLLGTGAAATSGIGAVPFAHPPPTTTAPQCRRNIPRRRQSLPTASSAAAVVAFSRIATTKQFCGVCNFVFTYER